MKSNMAYIAAQLEEDRQALEDAAHTMWTLSSQPSTLSNYEQVHEEAVNALGAALAKFGRGPAASKPVASDPRRVPPSAHVEAFQVDDRQRGPI